MILTLLIEDLTITQDYVCFPQDSRETPVSPCTKMQYCITSVLFLEYGYEMEPIIIKHSTIHNKIQYPNELGIRCKISFLLSSFLQLKYRVRDSTWGAFEIYGRKTSI